MSGKRLSLLLAVLLIFSSCFVPVQAWEAAAYDSTGGPAEKVVRDRELPGADRAETSDRYGYAGPENYEEPQAQNPYGAEKLKEKEASPLGAQEAESALPGDGYGDIAYRHLVAISEDIGARVSDYVYGGDQGHPELQAREYIADEFRRLGYSVSIQPFDFRAGGKTYSSANVIAGKPGISDKKVIIGAHYDSVSPKPVPVRDGAGEITVAEAVYMYGKGADDNASGVAIMLEAAERIAALETPYAVEFVAFGAEERGLKGSNHYAAQLSEEDTASVAAMINLDSCIAGDYMYVHGNEGEKGWVRELALDIAGRLGLDLRIQEGLNEEYPAGTTGLWSDHAPFERKGIPFAYFEATNWTLGDMDGYVQVDEKYGINGEIWHTGYDNIEYMKDTFPGRIAERLRTYSQVLTNMLLQVRVPGESVVGLSLNDYLVSVSKAEELEVTADLGYMPQPDKLEWTLGGADFSLWKKYDPVSRDYTGEPFITFVEPPTVNGSLIKAKLRFDLPYGTENLNGTPRRLYPALLGSYRLEVRDTEKNKAVSTVIKYNAYDSYHTYDQMKPAIDDIMENAGEGRYIEYKSLGKSAEGRDMHFVILAEDQEAVDQYLNETLPLMLEDPQQLQDRIEEGTIGDYKLPLWFNNIHPDEAPGIDAIINLFRLLATEDTITYRTTDSEKIEKTERADGTNREVPEAEAVVAIDVKEALEHFIFLFNFTENPDGRYYNTRANVNGFDLNRDNFYQTQVETRLTAGEITKWLPLSFLDFHGFMPGFCIEPCTTPHDPNFEYDLLIESMLEQAHLMGKAGIANTKYTNYEIPFEDYNGGWDDGVPSYTAVYAMLLGALGHTVEIPELNEDSVDALVAVGLANIDYVTDNKDSLFYNQLECYDRGLQGIDAGELVDPWLLNAAGEVIGRPRGDNDNFFPEYYVIPVDTGLQKNTAEAYELAEYLVRNGIELGRSTGPVKSGEMTYPEGSFVVDMHQPLRGYANELLYDGYDVSDFAAMYAEIVNAFHDTRGFDRYEVREPGVFEGKTERVTKVQKPSTQIPQAPGYYVIRNNSNEAVRAVNRLLNMGGKVELLLEAGNGYSAGDYLVARAALAAIAEDYLLEVSAYSGDGARTLLKNPIVLAPSASGHMLFALEELGFKVLDSTNATNIIVTDAAADVTGEIASGKPYVGVGGSAMRFVMNTLGLEGFDYLNTGYEALMRCTVAADSLITSNYPQEAVIYNAKGGYISSVPEGAKVLVRVKEDDSYFKAGWWPDTDMYMGTDYGKLQSKGKALSFTTTAGEAGAKLTVFANNLVNKAHPQSDWRMLANAIFTSLADTTTKPDDNTHGGGSGSKGSGSKASSTVQAGDPYKLELPYEAVSAAGVPTVVRKSYETALGVFELPDNMLTGTGLGKAGDTIGISLRLADSGSIPDGLRKRLEGKPVFDIRLFVNGVQRQWNNPGAPVRVAVKYSPGPEELKNPDNIVIWYLDEKTGTAEPIPNCRYDAATGMVTFTLTHFSKYAVVYDMPALEDIEGFQWAEGSISAVAARGILQPKAGSSFQPERNITRGEFMCGLVRTLGLSAAMDGSFSDVDPGSYCYRELATAKALGIAQGVGSNQFRPDSEITRQDMMVLTDRALKAAGRLGTNAAADLASYADSSGIAAYARASAARMVADGIITGSAGRINPLGMTTRAEAAVILHRLLGM